MPRPGGPVHRGRACPEPGAATPRRTTMACSPVRTAATAALVVLLVCSCSAGPTPAADAPGPTPNGSAPGAAQPPSSPAASATPSTAPSTTPPAASPRRSAPVPTAEAPATRRAAEGERRGDLVRGRRTVTGTVSRTGRWVLLDAGTFTWVLLGAGIDRATAGSRVTATGAVTAVPAGCPADRALVVNRID